MWVRKNDEEIQALKKRRFSARERLNPVFPLVYGIVGGSVGFVSFGLLGARGPFYSGTPLPYEQGLWNAFKYVGIVGFVISLVGAYVIQMVRGTLRESPPRMCPKCWKVLWQMPPCQCGLPWEPIEWWRWVPDDEQNPGR
jgi:hypothetical protein